MKLSANLVTLGGLGISNLRNLGWALHARWLWLQKTEPHRPWSALPIQVPGKTWTPAKCRFFLWLVAHKRCSTSDRLAQRGLPHPEKCPLCDQANESIDHLLIACVLSRQFWYYILRQVSLHSLAPQPTLLLMICGKKQVQQLLV